MFIGILFIQKTNAQTIGPNLIANPSFSQKDASGNPVSWFKGGYGNHTRQLTYPVLGNDDGFAATLAITNYVSGDAKWYFADVNVNPGDTYQFSNYSKSNVSSIITVRYKMSDQTFTYKDIAHIAASSNYQKNTVQLVIPLNVVSITIFHLINKNGDLTVDEYSLNKVTGSVVNNLVPNGNFETDGSNGNPLSWQRGGWGTNSREFTYPSTQMNGTKSARVTLTSVMSGDAKWYFAPLTLSPGTYTYSNQFLSNTGSVITIQYQNNDGSYEYKDLRVLPVANSPTSVSVDFYVNNNVKNVTVFHLINSVGYLTIDNVSIVKKSNPTGIFTTGAITLRFDDGTLSQYQNVIPKLNSLGIKGTFYIVTRQKADDGFPGYMSLEQIRNVYNAGHEIGAHTQTHKSLTQLTQSQQIQEIAGSRNDLIGWGLGSIKSFAYPLGNYNDSIITLVKNAGFSNAAATNNGTSNPTISRYEISRNDLIVNNSFAQYKIWIDDAIAKKEWLVLNFHEVNNSGLSTSVTPATFNQVVDYIVSKNIPIITISEGAEYLK